MTINESHVEDAAIEWFGELGYAVGHGPQLALPACRDGSGAGRGEPAAEPACALQLSAWISQAGADRRDSFGAVVLVARLREAILRLNPAIPGDARAEVAGNH